MHRFDVLSQVLSSSISRRSTVLGAAATAAAGLGVSRASAGEATPAATPLASPVPSDTDTEKVPFLFVQSASSATYAQPDAGSPHRLTLKGHTGGTIFFSDRPERIFGEAPTQQFLDGLGFEASDPPNAAIVTTNTDGTGDILIVELTDPAYDATNGELSYSVSALETYTGDGLTFAANQQQDMTLAADLGSTSLFIDDCSDTVAACLVGGGCVDNTTTLTKVGRCYNWEAMSCDVCWSVGALSDLCNETFSQCIGECTAAPGYSCAST
ncbi:MAG: hypothetical protein QM753_07450 [Thermomicrobiales bacterium]